MAVCLARKEVEPPTKKCLTQHFDVTGQERGSQARALSHPLGVEPALGALPAAADTWRFIHSFTHSLIHRDCYVTQWGEQGKLRVRAFGGMGGRMFLPLNWDLEFHLVRVKKVTLFLSPAHTG